MPMRPREAVRPFAVAGAILAAAAGCAPRLVAPALAPCLVPSALAPRIAAPAPAAPAIRAEAPPFAAPAEAPAPRYQAETVIDFSGEQADATRLEPDLEVIDAHPPP